MRSILLLLLLVALDLAAALKRFDLNITLDQINPDCSDYAGYALVANHQLPGPVLEVEEGERVQVTVRNFLPRSTPSNITGAGMNDVTVHFHGIRQYSSAHSDGVPFLTQQPIPPGAEFTHYFHVVNQVGTYFYHAHVGLQEQTLFGPFIIHSKQEQLSEKYPEHIISLSEWWHASRTALEEYFLGPEFEFIPEAQSVLINGRTLYNTDRPSPQNKDVCGGYTLLEVDRGKTYRLRVIGASTFRTLGFGIAHHNLTIIEVDGERVKPYSVPFLEVTPGQRFSVLLHAVQPVGDYTMATNRRWAEDVSRGSNGMGILRYNSEHDATSTTTSHISNDNNNDKAPVFKLPPNKPYFPLADSTHWIWSELEPLYGVDPVVNRPASRTIKLRATDMIFPTGERRWFINGIAYTEPERPILMDILQIKRQRPIMSANTFHNGYDPYLATYPLYHYEIVDFVLQSTHIPGEPCRSHPWHTHGHSHWEIAHGLGEYDEFEHSDIRNNPHPIQKDVTLGYPGIDPDDDIVNGTLATEPVGCGWSKIRILADNPGVWLLHCHNSPHMLQGMMVVLEESPELINDYLQSS
ncbi:Cupredoxin [Zychaea mexicana]|uniref:Cupredoxin n=1 Tax=Zychaea mexicana TaxID=64656 RepID=UPI0022FE44DD|nr:Cupredoxin [Zychaea mexicana]KAI9497306.1 Cupredoxin [Zychaea mexicana]